MKDNFDHCIMKVNKFKDTLIELKDFLYSESNKCFGDAWDVKNASESNEKIWLCVNSHFEERDKMLKEVLTHLE